MMNLRPHPTAAAHAWRVLLLSLLPISLTPIPGAWAQDQPPLILFNEVWLRQSWEGHPSRVNEDQLDVVSEQQLPDINDRSAVIHFILEHCPAHPIVYPTEQYYYFKFTWKHRRISGNLRFCDAHAGTIHFGYFDEYDHSFMRSGSIKDGVNGRVEFDHDKVNLEFHGSARRFRLASIADQLPAPTLDVGEQLITEVVDESGHCFWLVYNQPQRLVYYVLDQERRPEKLTVLNLSNVTLFIGINSRFVFFLDRKLDRLVLIGVWRENILKNNYFDGPFDQVPPKLQIKRILEDVYPYLKLRQIDAHGNFLDEPGSRVAISPYIAYHTISELLTTILNGSAAPEQDDANSITFHRFVRESKGAVLEQPREGGENPPKADQ